MNINIPMISCKKIVENIYFLSIDYHYSEKGIKEISLYMYTVHCTVFKFRNLHEGMSVVMLHA